MPERDLIPVVQRSYDLCAGLYEHVNRFPRAQRGLLGRVILDDGLRLLTLLTVANRRREKSESLAEASGHLDAVRIALRLGQRLGYLSNGGYERLTHTADEVGRMLGGWIRHETPAAAEPPAAPPARPRTGGSRYTMTSPTVARYLRARLAHPEAIVFVTVGAFCQTFFEDAVFCARTFGFQLRNLAADSEPEKILACGFPRSRLEHYRAALLSQGRAVHAE
jgi:hypothetical protein